MVLNALRVATGANAIPQIKRRAFSNSGSSTNPGFLLYDNLKTLQKQQLPKLVPETLRTVFPNGELTTMTKQQQYKPSLTARFRSVEEAKAVVSKHINQELPSMMKLLRIATRPSIQGYEHMSLNQLAKSLFAEAIEEMRLDEEETTVLDLNEFDAQTDVEVVVANSSSSLEGPSTSQASHAGALTDHIQCSSVLKKRRKRMRRHKHKKRLRKNRYKKKK